MELLFTVLWKSAIIITLFYGFYRFFLQKETYFKLIRYFLVSGIVIAFVLPLISIPIYTEPTQLGEIITSVINHKNTAAIISKPSINWIKICLYIYSIVTAALLLRFIFQLFSIAGIIMKSEYIKTGNYYCIETHLETSPFSFFNFIIYNPSQFSKTELCQIIAHEKIHALQKHSVDTLASNLLTIIQWYNPFAWIYKRDIEQNLEFIADEYAQKQSNSNQSYQQLLVKTSIPDYQMALANNFYNSLLKKRIIMLHKKRSSNTAQWKIAFILPFLFIFTIIFNTKVTAQQKKNNGKTVKVNVEVYAIGISKESTKDDLKEVTTSFEKKGLDVKFSNLKRNGNGEITSIRVDANAKNGKASASYAADDTKGINPIQISFDNENNNLSIGSSDEHTVYGYSFSNNGNRKMVIDIDESYNGEGTHEIIIDNENGTETETIRIKNKKGDSKDNFIFISDDDDKNTITTYIVNGKKISKEAFKKFDKDKIKTIEIIKEVKKEK